MAKKSKLIAVDPTDVANIKLTFLDNFKKAARKIKTVSLDHEEPRYWISCGSHPINRMISGNYYRAVPQGRIVSLAGISGSGKSFLCGNTIKQCQDNDWTTIILDSEGAQSPDYLNKIGVDCNSPDFIYASVNTVNDVAAILNQFIDAYTETYSEDFKNAPRVLIVLDSVDMLMTENELNNFDSGEIKSDMGIRAKMTGALLKIISSKIKLLNISMLVVQHTHRNQDIRNGQGTYVINAKSQYYSSFIILLEKFKLREGTDITGMRMRASVEKSRFAKLGDKAEIHIPWDTGMDPTSGVLDFLKGDGIVENITAQKMKWIISGEEFKESELDAEMFKRNVEDIIYNTPASASSGEDDEDAADEPTLVDDNPTD